MTKFGMEMKKYVVIHNHDKVKTDKKKIGGKTENCWFGIKEKDDEE